MKTAIRLALMGVLALGGGLAFGGVGTASAACVQYGGGIVCGKPVVKKRHYVRHHKPRVVIEFGRPHRQYYSRNQYWPRHGIKRRHWGHRPHPHIRFGGGFVIQGHGRY